VDPYVCPKVIKELDSLLEQWGVNQIKELTGMGWKNGKGQT
jgi:hypothetical protein